MQALPRCRRRQPRRLTSPGPAAEPTTRTRSIQIEASGARRGLESCCALAGAYGSLHGRDGAIPAAWQLASARDDHIGRSCCGPCRPCRRGAAGRLLARRTRRGDRDDSCARHRADGVRTAAFAALGATHRVIGLSSNCSPTRCRTVQRRRSATAASGRSDEMPLAVLPASRLDTLAKALVALVSATPAPRRLDADTVEAHRAWREARGRARRTRRSSGPPRARGIGVQVVRIETVPEELRFNIRWFVVEAGKRIQILLSNRDAMLHNLVVGRTWIAGADRRGRRGRCRYRPIRTRSPASPDSPLVVAATRLLGEGETDGLDLVAPKILASTSTCARSPDTGSGCTASCWSSTTSTRGKRTERCRSIP